MIKRRDGVFVAIGPSVSNLLLLTRLFSGAAASIIIYSGHAAEAEEADGSAKGTARLERDGTRSPEDSPSPVRVARIRTAARVVSIRRRIL
jgi:hypothetical protein